METVCVLCSLPFEARTSYGICSRCCNELNLAEWDRLQSTIQRYARKGGRNFHITLAQWLATVQDFKGRCAYCERHRHHDIEIIDMEKGIIWNNIVPICDICKRYRRETFTASEVRVRDYLMTGRITPVGNKTSLVFHEKGIVLENENISWGAMEKIVELGEK